MGKTKYDGFGLLGIFKMLFLNLKSKPQRPQTQIYSDLKSRPWHTFEFPFHLLVATCKELQFEDKNLIVIRTIVMATVQDDLSLEQIEDLWSWIENFLIYCGGLNMAAQRTLLHLSRQKPLKATETQNCIWCLTFFTVSQNENKNLPFWSGKYFPGKIYLQE